MKIACLTVGVPLGVLGLALWLVTMVGCQTDQPGVKNTVGAYSAVVDAASPDKTTNAGAEGGGGDEAERRHQQRHEGWTATSPPAQHRATWSTSTSSKSGDNVSDVSVRVGTAGDRDISMEIIKRIKGNLHWFGGKESPSDSYHLRNMAGTYTALD